MSAPAAARSAARKRPTRWPERSRRTSQKNSSGSSIAANAVRNLRDQLDRRHRRRRRLDRHRGQHRAETMIPLSAVAVSRRATRRSPSTIRASSVATTISFNLAPGVSLSEAVAAIDETMSRIGMPATIHGGFPGHGQVFQQSLANEPYLIAAALVDDLHRRSACSTRATSTRSRSCRPCPRRASARCWR